ncbi:XTP/dITP diphosphatase [Virgibacillus halodenitrificans]|uniref:XTP/dITP diphosphatase n=1 Tax=Virgibacillus halodenitrificans TaxID=1482 RepID=UPI000310921A|nr:XTP/dITP diphosphatase [Virgibacillus halodenitrificans]
MKEIIIATKNKGKAEEFKSFFGKYGISIKSLLDFQEVMPDVEETGITFKENAALKAEEISTMLSIPVLADDSGLVIDALNGEPGIYSARYAGEPKNDQANMNKVLKELQDVPKNKRKARFVCVLAIAIPGEATVFREGYCEGEIAFSPRGAHGFGYDPIFIPQGYNKTMAELSAQQKNEISHRRNAINQLEDWIRNI